jgi:hypothetical protein
MSSIQQFINSNNQSLLWKVINNTPQMIHYFSNAPPGEREKWFQYMMGQIYNQYKGQNAPLKEINKRAIDVMLQSLVPLQPQQPQMQQQMPPQQQQPQMQMQQQMPPQKQQQPQIQSLSVSDQFSRRQAEYELMVKKEVPVHNFTENVKDEAILDLNSAVEAYKRNRNEDVDVIIPAPTGVGSFNDPKGGSFNDPSKTSDPSIKKLDLSNATPISLIVEELPKKMVQWGDNVEHVFDHNHSIFENKLNKLEKDMEEIKSKLNELLSPRT